MFKRFLPFIIVTAAVTAAIIIVTALGRGFALGDFKVYYGAAQSFFGGQQLYGIEYATPGSFYKYSPFSAMLAGPFLLLPYPVDIVLQYIIMSIISIAMMIVVFNLVNTYLFNGQIKWPNTVLLITLLCFLQHLVRELTVGNINLLLLLFLALCLQFIPQKRFVLAGILLAFVLISKPFFVLLLMPLVLRRYFKILIVIACTLVVFVLLPALFTGISKDIELHKQWLHAMVAHSGNYYSPNTLDMILRKSIYSALPDSFQYVILLAACVGFVILFYIIKRNKTEELTRQDLLIEWFVLIGLMCTVFRTDTQHFLFTMPLIMIWCCYLLQSRNKLGWALFIITILLYDGNSSDVLGRNLSNRIFNAGILGVSNMIIVAVLLIFYFRKRAQPSVNSF